MPRVFQRSFEENSLQQRQTVREEIVHQNDVVMNILLLISLCLS